jgi:hypothetical protein
MSFPVLVLLRASANGLARLVAGLNYVNMTAQAGTFGKFGL